MGARNQEQRNLKFYALKAKVDEKTNPEFVVTEKVNDTWQVTGRFSEMFGVITKIEMVEKEYKGVKSNYFKFYIVDENETSVVDMTHNAITYSILNTLASDFDTSKQISISVYKKESEKDANGNTFWNGRASVTAEGEKLNWAIEIADMPRPEQLFNKKGEPVLTNGKNTYDNSGVIAFWEDVFVNRVQPKFKSENAPKQNPNPTEPVTTTPPDTTPNSAPVTNTTGGEDEDDLPF